MTGAVNSKAEVTHVSRHCVWLLVGDEELAMSFVDFPWFKKATIEQLTNVERPSPDHLYWPDIDVDLSVESIRNPVAARFSTRRITNEQSVHVSRYFTSTQLMRK